jgi:dATP pyrophosphohydrolase
MVKNYRKAVFIVIYRKSKTIFNKTKIKFLILKRKLHWVGWEFPKGGIEPQESLLKTVERETFEETGQYPKNIKSYKLSGKYNYLKELPDRNGFVGQTYKLFSAELSKKNIIFDKLEHSNYKWVSYEKAMKLLTYPNQKKCLKEVNKGIKK